LIELILCVGADRFDAAIQARNDHLVSLGSL
jgi:hypothetical protein